MYKYKDPYQLDFRHVQTYGEVHKIIKAAMDFPDYYGENWDAFWDCLTDMIGRPVHIEIIGLDNIERKFGNDFVKTMVEILKDFKHYDNNKYSHEIQIEIVSGETRVNLI